MRKRPPNFHIAWETFPYRDGPDVHWFRHTDGTTPICKAYRVEGGWELLFLRGPANLGPYFYRSFKQLKWHLDGYLRAHGERLMGPRRADSVPARLYVGEVRSDQPDPATNPAVVVPWRRARRRYR